MSEEKEVKQLVNHCYVCSHVTSDIQQVGCPKCKGLQRMTLLEARMLPYGSDTNGKT